MRDILELASLEEYGARLRNCSTTVHAESEFLGGDEDWESGRKSWRILHHEYSGTPERIFDREWAA
jgi:hypothetical protein